MENILCVCPKCRKRCSLSTEKNIITCEECGLKVEVDNRYQLSGVEFENIAEWYAWQTNEFRKAIQTEENFYLQSKVELRHLSKNKKGFTEFAGEGICKLDKNGLLYTGTRYGEQFEKFFKLDDIYRLLFGAGEDFEIYENDELYYFVPEDKKSCVIWYIISALLKE